MRSKSNTIRIGEDYRIGADAMNIILYERHIGKRKGVVGKDVWTQAGYFSTVQNALSFLVEHEVKKTELKDLNDVVAKIEEVKAMIRSLPPLTIRSDHVGQG